MIRLIQTLCLPDWLPPTINQLLAGHWRTKHRLKMKCHEFVAVYSRKAGIVRATCKRRVTVTLTLGPRNRLRDQDSSHKALLDSLVHAELLIDDSPKYCELVPLIQERGAAAKTTITLEDL